MTNLDTQVERRERVVQDVVDASQSHTFWLLDLVGRVVGVLLWWR
ncbi:MAG: hypothetical protein M5U25_19895 [Planctomycetota bacterium]|nr:hypothetical protein [Planctomycetota bacterium]